MFLSLSICAISFAQTVSGTVTGTDDEPLIGATVLIQGTNTGASTDFDGNYSITANSGDVLEISYVGYLTQNATVSGSNMNFNLAEDATRLSDVVVTATRQPIRKIQATTAITSVGFEEIKSQQPETFNEAIEGAPGVTNLSAQGRKPRFNIRGFPGGNPYTTFLVDGLPQSGFANLSSNRPEFLALDHSIERIEVVRGSGATLFGRSAAAGAINVISKTGGEKTTGSANFTKYNNVMGEGHKFDGDFDYRLDFNINGPLADKLRYNLGVYLLEDSGIKESSLKDKGAQVRLNLDYLISKTSKVRVYGSFVNNSFQNITDVPWDMSTNSLAEGWGNENTYYHDASQLDFTSSGVSSVFAPPQFRTPIINQVNGEQITQNPALDSRNEVNGSIIGLDATFDLGNGWSINEKLRFQNFGKFRDQNEITFGSFYTAAFGATRINIGGIQTASDLMNETRIQKTIKGENATHNLSAGVFISKGKLDRLSSLWIYGASVDPRSTFSAAFAPPGTPISQQHAPSSTTTSREESATGMFIGDEIIFNEKLRVNVGLRYDITDTYQDNNPGEIEGVDYDPAELVVNDLDKFEDYSWSIGANYLVSDRNAFYGNFMRAFSFPIVNMTTTKPEENEIIKNLEIGYRAGIGDLGIDLALFNTTIDNRLATIFDGTNLFVQKPVGKNSIRGGELALTYAPTAVKGLLLRTSITLQNSQYDEFVVPLDLVDTDGDFVPDALEADLDNLQGLRLVGSGDLVGLDVSGNQVANTPNFIFNFNIGYNTKRWGIDFGGFNYSGRYPTALNIYEMPDLSIINGGAHIKFPLGGNILRVGVRARNLFNSTNPQELFIGSASDDLLIQRQRSSTYEGVLGFGVVQAPRRILLTIGYDF